MFVQWIYDETKQNLESKLIQPDSRGEPKQECFNGFHIFPPATIECVCGKYADIKQLVLEPEEEIVHAPVESDLIESLKKVLGQ